jgi:putative glutamine amidotransferase
MPTIAVTECRKIEDYKHAVEHAGGTPHLVNHETGVEKALADAGGVLLTGGDDVAPGHYGEDAHESVVKVSPERDKFELELVREARRRGLPIFAICRGLQVMNVACGGTLVQDIPSQVPGALEHRLATPPHQAFEMAHEVWLEKDSLLAKLMRERLNDADSCQVNSRHHQAIKIVAPGFKVSATAPDGVIEAIEDPNVAFCLGVQWHPENFWRTGEFRSLFEGFVSASTS